MNVRLTLISASCTVHIMANSMQKNRGGQKVNICPFLQWRPGVYLDRRHTNLIFRVWLCDTYNSTLIGCEGRGEEEGEAMRREGWGGGRGEDEGEREHYTILKEFSESNWFISPREAVRLSDGDWKKKTNRKWKGGGRRSQGGWGNGGDLRRERSVIW